MQLSERPVVFLTYANVLNKPSVYLPALEEERQGLRQELDRYDQKGWGIWKESPAAPNLLVKNLIDWQHQLVVFHFSGHATTEKLQLTTLKGEATDLAGQNLINLLKAARKTLKLVFLNACLTRGHVEALTEIGVPAIVATSDKVNDQLARTFSTTFYGALVRGATLQVAFDAAHTAIAASHVYKQQTLLVDDEEEDADYAKDETDWKIFYPGGPEMADWTLKPPHAIDVRLRKGSAEEYHRLVPQKEAFAPALLTPVAALPPHAASPQAAETRAVPVSETDRFGEVDLIERLDRSGHPYAIFQGEGGSRKSNALFYLWRQIKERHEAEAKSDRKGPPLSYSPLVLYLPLFEYNTWPQAQKSRFISQYIIQRYLKEQAHNPETEKHFWEWLIDPEWEHPYPKVLLLLDGLNEINVDKSELLIQIRRTWANLKLPKRTTRDKRTLPARAAVQVLITGLSGTDFKWAVPLFTRFHLLPLRQEQIRAYLQSQLETDHFDLSQLPRDLQGLLSNPTMLSLYAEYALSLKQGMVQRREEVSTPGELWDLYIQSFIDRAQNAENRVSYLPREYTRWQLHHLLPALCFQMVQEGRMEYKRMELKDAIEGYLQGVQAHLEDYFEVFPEMERIWEKLEQETPNLMVSLRLTFSLLSEEQIFLRRRGQRISFLQQSYRRYFAARHIINELALSQHRDTLPASLLERPLPTALSEMIGQVLQEHLRLPEYDPIRQTWTPTTYPQTLLDQLLDFCRDDFDAEQVAYLLWNIIQIWRRSRTDLSGVDLTRLGLHIRNINLNEIRCSRLSPHAPGHYFTTDFQGCRLLPQVFFPEGHTERITAITSSPDGKLFLTASDDKTIKIWSVRRGICLNTLNAPGPRITTLSFHPREWKFLAGTQAGTLSEWAVQPIWNTLDGVKLQTFAAHETSIRDIEYEADGEGFLSIEAAHTLKRWYPDRGLNVPIQTQHHEEMRRSSFEVVEAGKQGIVIAQGFADGTCLLETLQPASHTVLKTEAGPVRGMAYDLKVWERGKERMRIRSYQRRLFTGHAGKLKAWADPKPQQIGQHTALEPTWQVDLGEDTPTVILLNAAPYHQVIAGGKQGTLYVWEQATGQLVARLDPKYQGSIASLCLAKKGEYLFSGGKDGRINLYLFEALAGEKANKTLSLPSLYRTYTDHVGAIAAMSATDTYLVSGSIDGSLRIWDLRSTPLRSRLKPFPRRLSQHTDRSTKQAISAIHAHAEQPYFAVGYTDGCVVLWEVVLDQAQKARAVSLIEPQVQARVAGVALQANRDGTLSLYIGYEAYRVEVFTLRRAQEAGNAPARWEAARIVDPHSDPVSFQTASPHTHWDHAAIDVVCVPPRKQVIAATPLGFHVQEYRIQERSTYHLVSQVAPGIKNLAAHPTEDQFVSFQKNGDLIAWSRELGQRQYRSRKLAITVPDLSYLHYSLDGSKLLIGSASGDLTEWNIASGENTRTFYSQRLAITHMVLSPTGHRMLTVSDDKPDYYAVKEWDLQRRVCRAVYVLAHAVVTDLCYGEKETHFFAATEAGTLIACSTENGEVTHTYSPPEGKEGTAINRLMYLPPNEQAGEGSSGHLLATYDTHTIYAWGEGLETCLGPVVLERIEEGADKTPPTLLFAGAEAQTIGLVYAERLFTGKFAVNLRRGHRFLGQRDTPFYPKPPSSPVPTEASQAGPAPLVSVQPMPVPADKGTVRHLARVDAGGHVWETPIQADFIQLTAEAEGPIHFFRRLPHVLIFFTGNAEGKPRIECYESPAADGSWQWKVSCESPQARISSLATHPFLPMWVSGGADGSLCFWQRDGQLVSQYQLETSTLSHLSYSPMGTMLAYATETEVQLRVHAPEAGTWEATHSLPLKGETVSHLQFSESSEELLLVLDTQNDRGEIVSSLFLWNLNVADSLPQELIFDQVGQPLSPQRISCVAFTPQGSYLAAGTESGHVILWEKGGYRPHRIWRGTQGGPVRLLNPYKQDGVQRFFAFYADGLIRDWVVGHDAAVSLGRLPEVYTDASVQMDPHTLALVYPHPADLRVRYAHDLKFAAKLFPYWELPEEIPGHISALGYSPCGMRLRVGYSSGHIVQWRRQKQEEYLVWEFHYHIPGHDDETTLHTEVTALTAPPQLDEQGHPLRYFSASKDGTFREWDSETGALIQIWRNVPGMWMQGVDLREVGWARPLTQPETETLRLYGAILD